jgi:hypothetical protein
MKRYLVLIIIITGILVYVFIPSGDNRKIKEIFNEVREAGSKKDLDGVMEHFSPSYRDDYGMTYPDIKRIIKTNFDRFDSLDGRYSDLEVSLDDSEGVDKKAVAGINITVSGTRSGIQTYILGSEDIPEHFIITLIKTRQGDWKIVKIEGVDLQENF